MTDSDECESRETRRRNILKQRKEKAYKKLLDKEQDRKETLKIIKLQAYRMIAIAVVCSVISCATAWLLILQYSDELYPFDHLMWIIAGSFSLILIFTLCCTFCTLHRERFAMFYFVTVIIWFAFFYLLLAYTGFMFLVFNENIKFYDVDDALKTICVYCYLGFSILSFLFLLISGILGMRIKDLDKDNYFSDKELPVQWCPTVMQVDEEQVIREARMRKAKRYNALPKANRFESDFQRYITSFRGVIDLQQGKNDRGEINFFQTADLLASLPGLTMNDIDGPESTDKTVNYQPKLSNRKCQGRLLPSKQLRTEQFFSKSWGTALALALLRSKLPALCLDEGLVQESDLSQVESEFDTVIQETSRQEEKKLVDRKKQKPQSDQDPNPDNTTTVDEAFGEVRIHVADQSDEEEENASRDVNEDENIALNETNEAQNGGASPTLFGFSPSIRNAVVFLSTSLQEQRNKYHDLKSTAEDWVEVAKDVVEVWYHKMALAEKKQR